MLQSTDNIDTDSDTNDDPLSFEMDIVDELKKEESDEKTDEVNATKGGEFTRMYKMDGKLIPGIKCSICEKRVHPASRASHEMACVKRKVKDKSGVRRQKIQKWQKIENMIRYRCHHCDYSSSTHVDLKTHIALKHKEKEASLVCEICSKVFKRKQYLLLHKKMFHKKS